MDSDPDPRCSGPIPTRPAYVTIDIPETQTEENDIIRRLVEHNLEDVAVYILSMLDEQSVLAAEQFSKTWRNVITYGSLWKKILEKKITENRHWAGVAEYKKYRFLKTYKTAKAADCRKHYFTIQKDVWKVCQNWKISFGNGELLPTKETPCCLHFDDYRIAVGHNSGTVRVYTRSMVYDEYKLEGHRSRVTCVQIQGMTVVSGYFDGTIRVWDIETKLATNILPFHTQNIIELKLLKNVLISSSDNTICVWAINSLSKIDLKRQINTQPEKINCVAADSEYVVCGYESSVIKVWDMSKVLDNQQTVCPQQNFAGHTKAVTCLNLRDKIVISGGLDLFIQLWHVTNGDCFMKIHKPSGKVIDIHLNDERLVYILQNGFVKISTIGGPNSQKASNFSYMLPIVSKRSSGIFAKADEFEIMFKSNDDGINIRNYLSFPPLIYKYYVHIVVFYNIFMILLSILVTIFSAPNE